MLQISKAMPKIFAPLNTPWPLQLHNFLCGKTEKLFFTSVEALLIFDSVVFSQRRYVVPYRHTLSQRFAKYAKVSDCNFFYIDSWV